MEFGVALYDALVGASVPPEKAKAVVKAMEKEMFDKLATKQDLQLLKQDLLLLEARLTARLGGMLVAAVTVLVALQKLI